MSDNHSVQSTPFLHANDDVNLLLLRHTDAGFIYHEIFDQLAVQDTRQRLPTLNLLPLDANSSDK